MEISDLTWNEAYNLACEYNYKNHCLLDIPIYYETKNLSINGFPLGEWIAEQRNKYNENKLSEEQVIKLKKIDPSMDLVDRIWNKFYLEVREFYKENKHIDIPHGYVIVDGVDLGEWVDVQKENYRNRRLSSEQINKLDKLKMNYNKGISWDKMYYVAKRYYEKNKNLLVPKTYVTKEGYELGKWLAEERRRYNSSNPNEEIVEKLKRIGMNFDSDYIKWHEIYLKAKKYYKKYGNLDMSSNYRTEDGYNLGGWVTRQRLKFQKGELTEEQIKKLKSIKMRFGSTVKTWDQVYEMVLNYYRENGNANIPYAYTTEDGYRLGAWIVAQRLHYKNGNLNKDKMHKLFLLGVDLNPKFKSWDEVYEMAKMYYEEHGNLLVPKSYVTDEGYALGQWIVTHRAYYNRGQLSEEKQNKLKEIGMIFDSELLKENINFESISKEYYSNWDEAYNDLQIYYAENGKINISKLSRTGNGYYLGKWIYKQKYNYKHGKLSEEQIKKLEDLGINFNKKNKTWDESFEIAKEYYLKHGDLNVTDDYVTEDGYRLGPWITAQRIKFIKGELDEERYNKCLSIEMRFYPVLLTWDEAFKIAEEYYKEHGDLDVKGSYVAKNGYNLGQWIIHQRGYYKKGKLSEEQIQKLKSIGMSFEKKNNVYKVKSICKKNGLDYEKYPRLLKLPYRELDAKIYYLDENEIPYIKDGVLNDIFFMSAKKFKETYNFTMDEFVEIYSCYDLIERFKRL